MFPYLWDPRSDNYYDESGGSAPEQPWTWSDVLLFPIHLLAALLFIFVLSILPPLVLIGYFLKDIYTTTQNTFRSGKLAYPFLFKVGMFLAAILALMYFKLPPGAHVHLSLMLVLAVCFVILFAILPLMALILHPAAQFYVDTKTKADYPKSRYLWLVFIGIVSCAGLVLAYCGQRQNTPTLPIPPKATDLSSSRLLMTASNPPARPRATATAQPRLITILVDDFEPQPYQGETVYFFNRLEGDRGAINNSLLTWGKGYMATTISAGNTWGGVWMSLNHPIRESQSINFQAILPSEILPEYQSQIVGLTVRIAGGTPGKLFKLELKDGNEFRWRNESVLEGGAQVIHFDLPRLEHINQLVWVLDQGAAGDYVVLEEVYFTATTGIADTAMAGFVWSYGMLLNNWNPSSGLVRDTAKVASGEFDAIQSTGCLAAATVVAEELGAIKKEEAVKIVAKIGETLLHNTPRYQGLWPHWVKISTAGEIAIVENTEWSSVDTVIAAIALLEAQSGLGMDTAESEQMLKSIEWDKLVTTNGISHGYRYSGELIPYAWDAFGGESWLVGLAYAAATGQVAALPYATPPTANGSGFIDELAWLFIPQPASKDYWGTNWTSYRLAAADNQTRYYPSQYPGSCFSQLGLFGLSAGETPAPSSRPKESIYQALGVGGRFTAANDGSTLPAGAPVVMPHYSAMIATLRPATTIEMWKWLINEGHFSPLNNVESMMFQGGSSCDGSAVTLNQLKGSWNLALQTLGWGRYLELESGKGFVLWQAAKQNQLIQQGYKLLTTERAAPAQPADQNSWSVTVECEAPDEASVGQMITRTNASGSKVLGQFGANGYAPWEAKPGELVYRNINAPQSESLFLKLHYSKYSSATVPILIYIDNEPNPRATFSPIDLGSWEQFTWSDPIPLGQIQSGVHAIKFFTDGQQYGVADLDEFMLSAEPAPLEAVPSAPEENEPRPAETPVVALSPGAQWPNMSGYCAGKPIYQWSLPGTYVYQQTPNQGDRFFFTVEQKSVQEAFNLSQCGGQAPPESREGLTQPPTIGLSTEGIYGFCQHNSSRPPGGVSITISEVEVLSTRLGLFQALRVDANYKYRFQTMNHNDPQGSIITSEWYVCGYGLVRSRYAHSGKYQYRDFEVESSVELVSYSPISSTESLIH